MQSRRFRWREHGKPLLVGLGSVGLVWLTIALWRSGTAGANKAEVLALLTSIVGLAPARQGRSRPALGKTARSLAQAVSRDRRVFLVQALGERSRGARLMFADPSERQLSPPMEEIIRRWRFDGDSSLSGSQDNIASLYRDVIAGRGGRLMVLGEPGAGKTVLLSRLIVDLIEALLAGEFPEGARVPVLFSLPSCDLGADAATVSSAVLADRMAAWMAEQLMADYGLSRTVALRLLADGWVLAVLDGLDEMDPLSVGEDTCAWDPGETFGAPPRPRAADVVRALNASPGEPLVVACRRLEYLAIAQTDAGGRADRPRMLTGQHVMMQPLTASAVVEYLIRRFPAGHLDPNGSESSLYPAAEGAPRVQARWQAVCDVLVFASRAPNRHLSAVEQVLSSPWGLFLATVVFDDPDSDPSSLLAMSPEQAREHLLDRLIPQLVARDERARINGWSGASVRTWLTAIARNQHQMVVQYQRSETDIHLPDLWRVADRLWPQTVAQLVSALPFYSMAGGLIAGANRVGLLLGGFLMCIGFVLARTVTDVGATTLERLDLGGRRKITRKLAFGLAFGVPGWGAFGLVLGVESGQASGLASLWLLGLLLGLLGGLATGLAIWLVVEMTGEVRTVRRPSQLVRQCFNYGLVTGLSSGLLLGLLFGLAAALIFGSVNGLRLGARVVLVLSTAGVLLAGSGAVWIRYALGVWSATRRGLLPARPARFLDWCISVGLMRMAGSNLQFRHRELQDHLTKLDDHVLSGAVGNKESRSSTS